MSTLARWLPRTGARCGGGEGGAPQHPGYLPEKCSESPAYPCLLVQASQPSGKHIFVLNNLWTQRYEMKNGENNDASHRHIAQIQKLLLPPIVGNTELKGSSKTDDQSQKLCSALYSSMKFKIHLPGEPNKESPHYLKIKQTCGGHEQLLHNALFGTVRF